MLDLARTQFTRCLIASLFVGNLMAISGCDSGSSTPTVAKSTAEIDAQNKASADYQKQKEAESKGKRR